jgi:hypothetical protein
MDRDDDLVRDEEDAAAAEAAAIGGNPGVDPTEGDPDRFDGERGPAFRAVEEGGGGDAEGFELAESLLEENATDGGQSPSPMVDRERTDEDSRAIDGDRYGDADDVRSPQDDDRPDGG